MKIESTPASRWAQDYKSRYFTNFGAFFMLIGIITLFGNLIWGAIITGLGYFIIHQNKKYWKNKK